MANGIAEKAKRGISCFLVPVLRFFEERDGVNYLGAHPPLRASLERHPVGYLSVAGSLLVPCGDAIFPRHLIGRNESARGERIVWDEGVPVPKGGEVTCLLVDGKFTIEQQVRVNGKHPALWYRALNGPRAVWGEWMNAGGVPFESAAAVNRHGGEIARRYFFADRGRGALFRHEPHIGNDGSIDWIEEIFCFISFFLKANENGKRTLSVRRIARRGFNRGVGFSSSEELNLEERRVVNTSRSRYFQECSGATAEFERRRRFFAAQDAGMRLRGRAFEKRLVELGDDDWEKALELVKEPWQLGYVIEEFCGQRFDASESVQDPQSQRIRRMIERHRARTERKIDLLKMAEEYGLV